MKLPYIKVYASDVLAASRNLTTQQIGDAILGICEQAFEGDTAYLPETTREQAFFALLESWKAQAEQGAKHRKQVAKKAAAARWQKQSISDGAKSILQGDATGECQPKPYPKPEPYPTPEPEDIKTLTAPALAAQGISSTSMQKKEGQPGEAGHHLLALPPLAKKEGSKTRLQRFSNQVLAHFEPEVKTEVQKHIWFKRNCRCLRDILAFCGEDIALALQTIHVCLERWEKAGITGGYEGICRNLPECCAQAQTQMENSPYGHLNA